MSASGVTATASSVAPTRRVAIAAIASKDSVWTATEEHAQVRGVKLSFHTISHDRRIAEMLPAIIWKQFSAIGRSLADRQQKVLTQRL